ncbi:MAG: hypothetical protein ACFE9L_09210 [Candidatus Hodarchaeota archaeon]
MALRTIFGLEGNPLEITQFEGFDECKCNLCVTSIKDGILVEHNEGQKVVFCLPCFDFLREGCDSIRVRQSKSHSVEEVGVQ